MTDRLYLRHSTDKQTNARQLHTLDSLLKSGARKYEDPATSSRVYAINRSGFCRLLDEAAVGDTIRIADAARLFRSTKDVIQIREVLQRRGLHLYIAAGAWSGFDLAADDPQTKLFVTMLAGVLEFQRDMISENTKEGVAAAEASGKTLGRPASLDEEETAKVIEAYGEGAAVKALARQFGVAPKTIRRVLDAAGARDLAGAGEPQEGTVDAGQDKPEPSTTVVLDMPGLLADLLQDTRDTAVREALHRGRTIRRGQGYSVRVTAPLALHQAALKQCAALAGGGAPAGRKAYRAYADRITAVTPGVDSVARHVAAQDPAARRR
ncbi:recombinase family protein [Streptomyces sp. H10-C2]|uniref:recombinase family protein n=1 Tax=unclassified Streptomyces TaxID=2593676 RepID=UPI0024B97ADF|nr:MULTISPECIES: recombinase family protein [unclassified Streptomyces]MDJ0344200.1 recombinase family protein [Streptomyces sp. PH10-H1]MDJ0373630.1 recombinase family protein [Streptomyces sp. H10-C2]MDJ0383728.1 recombinase family protein [Streptomyces sp. G-G2]